MRVEFLTANGEKIFRELKDPTPEIYFIAREQFPGHTSALYARENVPTIRFRKTKIEPPLYIEDSTWLWSASGE